MDRPVSDDDAAELTRCFRTHAKHLFGYACFVTRGDKALADDLVQEAFRAAAENWPSLRCWSDQQLWVWLRTAVHNIAVSVFRHNDLARRKLAEIEARYRPVEADTARDALTAIALERCWQAINRMPTRQHLIAFMCWKEGMKPSEIAEALDITASTVYVQLHDARKKLLAEIGPHVPFALDDRDECSLHDEKGGLTP